MELDETVFTNEKDNNLKDFFIKTFSTPEGQKVLKHLRDMTLERSTLPDIQFAGNNMSHLMCVREGENNLFRYIDSLVKVDE